MIDQTRSRAPLDVGGLLFLAEIASENGHQDQARACAEAALERDPDNIAARLQSASLAALMNDFSKAREEYERVLQLDPENKPALEMIDRLTSARRLRNWATRFAQWINRDFF